MSDQNAPASDPSSGDPFHTTRWSIVLAAGREEPTESSADALETLCQTYWFPVYVYVRRRVAGVDEAQDLTQAFFERLLEKRTIGDADPERGRFRAFLLTACKRFLTNEWHKGQAVKRGAGQTVLSLDFAAAESRYASEPADTLTAEIVFEQQWAITLLNTVLEQLRAEYVRRGRDQQFEMLKGFLSGAGSSSHAEIADSLGMTEGAVKVAAHRLRTRYRELIRAEIAQTVQDPAEVEDEIRRLFEVMAEKRGNSP